MNLLTTRIFTLWIGCDSGVVAFSRSKTIENTKFLASQLNSTPYQNSDDNNYETDWCYPLRADSLRMARFLMAITGETPSITVLFSVAYPCLWSSLRCASFTDKRAMPPLIASGLKRAMGTLTKWVAMLVLWLAVLLALLFCYGQLGLPCCHMLCLGSDGFYDCETICQCDPRQCYFLMIVNQCYAVVTVLILAGFVLWVVGLLVCKISTLRSGSLRVGAVLTQSVRVSQKIPWSSIAAILSLFWVFLLICRINAGDSQVWPFGNADSAVHLGCP